jgi:hypothetical protein
MYLNIDKDSKTLNTKPRQKFIDNIIHKSEANDLKRALQEWYLVEEDYCEDFCECGNRIKYRNIFYNKITRKTIIVGNDCYSRFNKFGIDVKDKLIENSFKKKIITYWEYKFLKSLKKFKKISDKQFTIRTRIKKKIMDNYNIIYNFNY